MSTTMITIVKYAYSCHTFIQAKFAFFLSHEYVQLYRENYRLYYTDSH